MYQEYVQKRIWGTKSLLTLNWYGLGVCGLWIFPHVFIIFPQYFRGCNFILPPSEHGRKSSQVPPGEREPWAKRSLWSAVCVCMCQGVRSRTECVWLWRTEFPYNSPSGSADLLPQPYVLVNFPNVWATFSTVYLLTLRVTFYVTCVFFLRGCFGDFASSWCSTEWDSSSVCHTVEAGPIRSRDGDWCWCCNSLCVVTPGGL